MSVISLFRHREFGYKIGSELAGEPIVDAKDLRALKPELDRFLDTSAPLFGREQNVSHARVFGVRPRVLHGDRRIAEAIDGPPVRTLQAFLATGRRSRGRNWRPSAVGGGRSRGHPAVLVLSALILGGGLAPQDLLADRREVADEVYPAAAGNRRRNRVTGSRLYPRASLTEEPTLGESRPPWQNRRRP